MAQTPLFIGCAPISITDNKVEGSYVLQDNQQFYKISNYTSMRPFLMSLVSHSDLWMFISSNGGLSAGRQSAESALFPYYTDDKISSGAEYTGSKTILRIKKADKTYLWEPFSIRFQGVYKTENNIYKNALGNTLIFEEINKDLELKFRYSWSFSERYGFVKKSSLLNISDENVIVEILDGVQDILPYGVTAGLQTQRSNLVHAYKKNELEYESGIGIFSLSAKIVDRAEPSEALKATTVWSAGIDANKYLLCSLQLDNFRSGEEIENETDIRAEKGAYFINATIKLSAKQSSSWYIVAEVNQSLTKIAALKSELVKRTDLIKHLEEDIENGNNELQRLVGLSDGIQVSNDKLIVGRHFSNVLFNIMRGGIFEDEYTIEAANFRKHIVAANKKVYKQHEAFLRKLPDTITYKQLVLLVEKQQDIDLQRLVVEYLPLSFSRRHGDPSRPWNTFSINISDEHGCKLKSYEGNWRDIFQNWEALAYSFPEFVEGMILKFVNASTIDGYNPYRITSNGIDWEVIEENDPWSYIGYWGDHQIIYLLRLLEICEAHFPGNLARNITKQIAVYANVPYRIKGYDTILENPSDTIDFDQEAHDNALKTAKEIGFDGKLLFQKNGNLVRANLAEKLLLTLLTKLYNFIPDAGIWLNTQRPEWNDANNALVGNGVSMVTLYHLRRFVVFCDQLFKQLSANEIKVNKHLAGLFKNVFSAFKEIEPDNRLHFSAHGRKQLMDKLGKAGEQYRQQVYNTKDVEVASLKTEEIPSFFQKILPELDSTIANNKREDGLYHSYNLMEVNNSEVKVNHLGVMLEGQVAILNAKILTAGQASSVLDALKSSKLFRPDQYSYLLYPDKDLTRFLDKNKLPQGFFNHSKLAQHLIDINDTSILEKDINGEYHFNGTFDNAISLSNALDSLSNGDLKDLVKNERNEFMKVFEEVFKHRYFTGRSGTFYGYEGLGSIYWHMVSKLLVATQESIYYGIENGISKTDFDNLVEHYYEIRAGIGVNKSPDLYGAFPSDPYSHTPGNKGAQQPGMTGQVKEDIINRWAELGVTIKNGKIVFNPCFLNNKEFLIEDEKMTIFNNNGNKSIITIDKGSLAFTYCGIVVRYERNASQEIEIRYLNGSSKHIEGNTIPHDISVEVFGRTQKIQEIIYRYSFTQ